MKRALLALMLLAFALPVANAQYTTTYHYGNTDITSYATSGTNAWKLLSGGGRCLANSFTPGFDGIPRCIGITDGYAYYWSNNAWTKLTAMGTGLKGLAANTAGNVWTLKITTACTNNNNPFYGYGIFKWNGSAWVQTASGCLMQMQAGKDGSLAGVNPTQLWKSLDGGATWTQIGSTGGWTFASIEDANTLCAINAGKVYHLVNGAITLMSPQPAGTLAGCAISRPASFMTWNTAGTVAAFNYNTNAWQTVSGLVGNSVVSTMRSATFALDSTGAPYHWNVYPLWAQGLVGGQMNGCPVQGSPCQPGVTHTGHIQVKFPHSINGAESSQVATPIQEIGINSWDANPYCDPLFGDPTTDPECFIGAQQPTDQVICSQTGDNLTSGSFAFPCLNNVPLPLPVGWVAGTSVTVYIDNHWNAAEQASICTGISNWVAFNFNAYTCATAYVAPGHGTAGSYIWVSYDPSYVDPIYPRGANLPCGFWFFHGYGESECPTIGGHVKHPWIVLGPYTDAELEGAAAHEEGHDNYLGDCYTCQFGGSVMGSQPTFDPSQPTAPTPCDIIWAEVHSLL